MLMTPVRATSAHLTIHLYPIRASFAPRNVRGKLTRAPLALQIFHHLLVGMFEHLPPPLSRLLLVVEKNEKKNIRKLVKNNYETISVNFSLRSKLWPPAPKNGHIFEFSRDCQTLFRKTSFISGTTIARANPKTAFQKELNSPSPRLRQI